MGMGMGMSTGIQIMRRRVCIASSYDTFHSLSRKMFKLHSRHLHRISLLVLQVATCHFTLQWCKNLLKLHVRPFASYKTFGIAGDDMQISIIMVQELGYWMSPHGMATGRKMRVVVKMCIDL